MASRFNHSCVPNTNWSWVGDVLLVRAIWPLAAGEELTMCYNPDLAHDRQQNFEMYGFTCACALCKADQTATQQHKDASVTLQQQMRKFARRRQATSVPLLTTERSILQAILPVLDAYSRAKYFDNGLPVPDLTMALVHLAHAMLGRTVANWRSASATKRGQAAEVLRSALAIGLQFYPVQDPDSAYCALATGKYPAVRTAGIIALIGLAELAYISPNAEERKRRGPLKACAKEMYFIKYGEDVTFAEKHTAYSCRTADAVAASKPDEKRCEGLEGEAKKQAGDAMMKWVKEAAKVHGMAVPPGWAAEGEA